MHGESVAGIPSHKKRYKVGHVMIAYISKALTDSQINWSVGDKEFDAIARN